MSCTRFGLPYQGSKNDIAAEIVSVLPRAGTLIDAFAGGCAVTHAALVSGKYDMVIANDINNVPQLFLSAIQGTYTMDNEKRWISKEIFHEKKKEDPFIRLCWSFGNDCVSYIYGEDITPLKKAMHWAVFHNNYYLIEQLGFGVPKGTQDLWKGLPVYNRYLRLKEYVAYDPETLFPR